MREKYHGYVLTDDPAAVDLETVCELLGDTYWASGRSRDAIAITLQNSLCFSIRFEDKQVGLARVLTDHGASSYICDVVIHPEHRRGGLGRWLMRCLLQHPAVVNTRALLITRDAQSFYRALGFVTHPFECMLKTDTGLPRRKVRSDPT